MPFKIYFNKPESPSGLHLEVLSCAGSSRLAFRSLFFNHQGDGGWERHGAVQWRAARRGSVAPILWSSSVEDMRRCCPSCLCLLWPNGSSPWPRSCGSSTSIWEAPLLRRKVPQRRRIKWFIPDVCVAASAVECVPMLRWRRSPRTRLRFLVSVWGPLCKSRGSGCNSLQFCASL